LHGWIDIVFGLLVVIYIPRVLLEYRRGARGLPSTAGWVMFMVGLVMEKGFPRFAPGQTWGVWAGSTLTMAGLLTMLVSWLVSRRRPQQSPM
jgi:hypothetical protein